MPIIRRRPREPKKRITTTIKETIRQTVKKEQEKQKLKEREQVYIVSPTGRTRRKLPKQDVIPQKIIYPPDQKQILNHPKVYNFIMQQLQYRLVQIKEKNGGVRYCEPYSIYLTRRLKIVFHCFQHYGYSQSGTSRGWKNIQIVNVQDVKILDLKWSMGDQQRPEYNPFNSWMMRVNYFQLPNYMKLIPIKPHNIDHFGVYVIRSSKNYQVSEDWQQMVIKSVQKQQDFSWLLQPYKGKFEKQ